jgi:hypothetical protein
MHTILANLKIHEKAIAYRRGVKAPISTNAHLHCKFSYSVRLDFKEFFPSIRPDDLLSLLNNDFNISDDDKEFLTCALFINLRDNSRGLAIGAPSSPLVSNAVMYSIDESLDSFAKGKLGIYTRYADDLVFSTNTRGQCVEFLKNVERLLQEVSSPKLHLNEAKTKLSSRGSRRIITGLIITPQGDVSLGRRNKRYIRKLLFEFKNSTIGTKELSYLRGYLAFILDVEPSLYNRLALKYGGDIIAKVFKSQ